MAQPIDIDPVHRITFPESNHIGSAVFSQDGSALYVNIKPLTVNVWQVLVDEWRISLGVLLGLLVLVCVVRVIRVMVRRRRSGSEYCRKCNYCLDGVSKDAPCPECGRPLAPKSVVKGKQTWRRLLPAASIGAVAVACYATLNVTGMPGGVRDWFQWHSLKLAEWVSGSKTFQKYARSSDRILEIDPDTGLTRRVVMTRSTSAFAPMMMTPDGKSLLLANGSTLNRVATASGRVIDSVDLPGDGVQPHQQLLTGFAGRKLILCVSDRRSLTDRICSWDLDTGELKILHESELYTNAKGMPSGRSAVIVPGDGLRVISYPTFSENYDRSRAGKPEFIVRDINLDASTVEERSMSQVSEMMPELSIDSKSRTMFVTDSRRIGVIGFDVDTGEHVGTLSLDIRNTLWHGVPLINEDRRWLIVVTMRDTILIRNIERQEWVGTLSYPDNLVRPEPFISGDGRRLAAIGAQSRKGPPVPGVGYVHELIIYDLSPLDDPTDAPP